MSHALEFTGERFLPGTAGAIAYEHWHRYAFASRYARGAQVLDAACGEGYGTALLASAARAATGLDIDPEAIAHARAAYAQQHNLRYAVGSVAQLPFPDASFDLVVSFETIEHLPQALQAPMLAEFARVLSPSGLLVLSSPNRPLYSDARDYRNPFHVHELDRAELASLLAPHFAAVRWHHQRPLVASALWAEPVEAGAPTAGTLLRGEAWTGDGPSVTATVPPEGVYHLVLAAREARHLPADTPSLSVFVDRDDSEATRAEARAAEVMRLDALLRDRDAACDRQMGHIQHLERLVAERDAAIAERDRTLGGASGTLEAARQTLVTREREIASARERLRALETEHRRLDGALRAQEHIIDYRQSARWWLLLPWVRVRLLWQRAFGRISR